VIRKRLQECDDIFFFLCREAELADQLAVLRYDPALPEVIQYGAAADCEARNAAAWRVNES
jgi:hypothetical protein